MVVVGEDVAVTYVSKYTAYLEHVFMKVQPAPRRRLFKPAWQHRADGIVEVPDDAPGGSIRGPVARR